MADLSETRLVWDLMRDLDQAPPHLKWLRRHAAHASAEDVEMHRYAATQPYNRLATLVLGGLLPPRLFQLIANRRHGRLWLDLVAPLDRAVRLERGGGRANVIETFWRRYADDGQIMVPNPNEGGPDPVDTKGEVP